MIRRGRLYSSCVQSSMSHGSEIWPVRKKMRWHFSRQKSEWPWMCDVKVKDRLSSKEWTKSLGIDEMISVLQQNRLRRYGHVLQKEDNDWVKKCMEYEAEGSRPKRTWIEVVQKDCQAGKLSREDAMDRDRWRS